MNNTNFMNATGLPDEMHYTTAEDLAVLTRALSIDFEHYATTGKVLLLQRYSPRNRNALFGEMIQSMGQTGHKAAGYRLVASAMENDTGSSR